MNNSTATVGGIVLVIIVLVGGWYLLSRPEEAAAPAESGSESTVPEETGSRDVPPAEITVTYSDQGFSPSSVTIAAGQTVTYVNQSSANMWVASAPHPAHTAYDGTSRDEHCVAGAPESSATFDQCVGSVPGTSWSFTFTKPGTWRYHDHLNTSRFGSVVVTAASAGVDVSATTTVNVE